MPDLFKTGLLVIDLERAMRDISAWLGVSWTPIQQSPLVLRTATGDEKVDLRFVFSTDGPPYLELLEAHPSGYYAAVDGPRERSIPARSSFLARAGALFPSLRHAVTPLLEKQGRTAKAAWRQRANRDVPA